MKKVLFLDKLEQLKALSDPLRITILSHLMEDSYTGQQLSEILEIPRSKVHYHLGELERNGIIEVVRREEKSGIMQKFYRSVGKSIVPSDDLMTFVDSGSVRQLGLEVINRLKGKMLRAPLSAFEFRPGSIEDQTSYFTQFDVRMEPEEFAAFLTEFEKLMEKMKKRDGSGSKKFSVGFTGFCSETN